ncbi:MAG: hypothetical protein EXQ71_00245 [Acidimicrobiia bacterium]|nr:hypothetical protein [Acidimicrobiia bacterium]
MDAAVLGSLVAFSAYVLWAGRRLSFAGDDWGLLVQGQHWGGLVEPYNDHLSILIIGNYRVLVEVFGLDYTPFRVAAVLWFLAIVVAWYLTTREQLSPLLAAGGVVALLALPTFATQAANLNHYIVGLGAVVCGWALRRDKSGWLAGGLALALLGTTGGVAVAVACLVHCACTRARWRQWVATLAPAAVWALWWLVTRHDSSKFQPTTDPTLVAVLRASRNVALSPFDLWHIDLLLMAGFVCLGAFQLRRGIRAGATWLAWTAALLTWSVGLSLERDRGLDNVYNRYQLIALIFVLLACVPSQPVRMSRVATVATAIGGVVAVGLAVLLVPSDVSDHSKFQEFWGARNRCLIADGRSDEIGFPGSTSTDEVGPLIDRYLVQPPPEHCTQGLRVKRA